MVGLKEAALWTDGRYFLQAEQQLDNNWTLMKAGLKATPKKEEWLSKVLPAGAKVGVDAKLISHEAAKDMASALKNGLSLVLSNENLIDMVWDDKPKAERNEIVPLSLKYAGRSSADKLESLQRRLKENNSAGFIVSALDEVAWLFNLRGSDIPFNPLFFSYALVLQDSVRLYLDESQIKQKSIAELAGIQLRPYGAIFEDLEALKSTWSADRKLAISSSCNAALAMAAGGDAVLSIMRSPIEAEKAIKNDVELEGFRKCHIRDAAALVSYFAWLEDQLNAGAVLDEVDGADKLEEFRRAQKDCIGLSFDTISGSGPNGAIIHYKPEKPRAANITMDQLYLCDSGGQYLYIQPA